MKPLKEKTIIPEIPTKPFQYLWYLSKPFKWWMFLAIFAAIVAAAFEQISNLFFKFIVDAVEQGNTERAFIFGVAYPVAIFGIQLLWRVAGITGFQWIARVGEKGYNELTTYAMAHSHGYFINRFAGSLSNKVGNVRGAMEDIIIDSLWTHLNAAVSFSVSFILIWTVDPLSSLIFVMLLVTLTITNIYLVPRKRIYSRALAEQRSSLNGHIVDIFSNASAVRQYTAQSIELKKIASETSEVRKKERKSWLYTEIMLVSNSIVLFVFGVGMFYLLVQRWSAGAITAGDFILVVSLVAQIAGTLIFFGRAFNNTARSVGEASEGLDELIVPHEILDAKNAKELNLHSGTIDWKNVTFKYDKNTVFKDFNLTIEPGQRVGLVGPSGAGKTTFVSLLLRQHDLTKGSIEIDGQNIAKVTQDSLRSNIAVVPQEPLLFHRTIRENIAYGKAGASDAEVIAVAKKAEAHEFIVALPDGYDTLVGERGVKLSGGQRQRIVIARAMLKSAPILILDEATSALDSESEVAIQKALHELMEGKTVIAIAHRLSTLREMDRILVLENGVVVEDGSHTELVGRGGLYAKLWEHQAGGFLQE